MTIEHRQFFGDSERAFRLTPVEIMELERLSGVGVGLLCKRTFAGEFSYSDLRNVIRLALIGAGTKPEDAEALCKAYVDSRPLAESFPLTVAILEAVWFGRAQGDGVQSTAQDDLQLTAREGQADDGA